MSIDRLLGERAKRSLTVNALGRVIIVVLGRNQLLRGSAVLNPAHQSKQTIVLSIIEARNTMADVSQRLSSASDVPGRVLTARTVTHSSDGEELVKAVHLDVVRCDRRGDLAVEVRARPEGDDGISFTVPVDDLAASLLEGRQVVVVRSTVTWVDGFRETNYALVEGAPIVGLGGVQQHVFDRSSSHRVRDGRVANICYEGCSKTGYREDQGTVKVGPVVKGLVQSVELRTGDASRSVSGSLAQKSQRIEDTACRIHDDIVGYTILRITLLEDLIVDNIGQCSGDVVIRILRKVGKSGLTGPDAQVGDPPGWSSDEDSVECIGRDLHLLQSLATTC